MRVERFQITLGNQEHGFVGAYEKITKKNCTKKSNFGKSGKSTTKLMIF